MKFFGKTPFPFKINSFRKAEETPSEGNFVNSDGNPVERAVRPSFANGAAKPFIANAQGERVNRVKNPSFSGEASPFFVNREGDVVQAATLPSYTNTEGETVDALASPLFVNKKDLPVRRARNPAFLSDEEIVHASPRNVSNFYSPSVTGKQAKTSRAVDEIRAEREEKPLSANDDGMAVDPMFVPLYETDENGELTTALRRDSFGPYSYMQHNDSDYVGAERRLIGAQGNWGEEGLGPIADDSEFASPTATRAEMLARILREEYLKREYLAQQGEKIGGLPFSPLATSARYYASTFDAKNMSANNSQGQSPRMWAFRETMQLPDNREEQKDWRHMTTDSPTPNSGKPYDLGESFRNSAAQDIADMIEAHLRATEQWPEQKPSIDVEAFKQGPSSRNFQAQKTKKAEEEEADKLKNSFSNIANEEIINHIQSFRDNVVRSMWENPDHLRDYEAAGKVLLDRLNESLKDDDRSEIYLDDLDTEGMDEEDIATWHAMTNATNERLVHYFSGHYPDFVHDAALSEISFRLQPEEDEPPSSQPPAPRPSAPRPSAPQPPAPQSSVSTNSFESIMNKFGHVKGMGTNLSDQEINSLSPEEFDVYSEALMDGSLDTWVETNTPTSSNNQTVPTPKTASEINRSAAVDPDDDDPNPDDEFLPPDINEFF